MRIAMLSWESLHSIAVGGVASHVTELSAALGRLGCELHVFTRMAPGQRYHECLDGVHYHRCDYPAHHEFVDDVNNMCRAFVERVFTVEDMVGRFDMIHAHDWLTANALIWIKRGRLHPGVFTVHATEYARCGNCFPAGRSHRVRDQERAGTYWSDRVIAVSSATRDELSWMYEVPDWKSHVVYNGVSHRRFQDQDRPEDTRRVYDIGPMDPTVLFSGRLVHQKGPDLLIEAIPPLLRHWGHAKFLFVGDGDMRGALEARARHLGVAHAVRFLGHRSNNDMPELYRMSDVVCVPSRNEPFGIVVLEAWSAGKPVVVTQVGGPNEYVWHEVNGLKIHPTPDSVGWGLGTIFADFGRARWMGANGRRAVEERFTWDQIAGEVLDVYAWAIGRNSGRDLLPPAPEAVPEPPMQERESETLDDSLRVRAKLSFTSGNGKTDTGIVVCEQLLCDVGLQPRLHGRTLRVEGEWRRVAKAVERCYRLIRREGDAPVITCRPCDAEHESEHEDEVEIDSDQRAEPSAV